VNTQPRTIQTPLQAQEAFFNNILCPVNPYRFFCLRHVIADHDKPTGCAEQGCNSIFPDANRVARGCFVRLSDAQIWKLITSGTTKGCDYVEWEKMIGNITQQQSFTERYSVIMEWGNNL